MAIKAKNLRQEAKKLEARMQEILTSSEKALSNEQEAEFDKLHDESEKLIRQAEKIERVEKLQIASEESEEVETPQVRSVEKLNPEEKKKAEDIAMRSYLKTGSVPQNLRSIMAPTAGEKDDNSMIEKALKDLGLEYRATQSTSNSAGGYTIPRGFMAELEKAVLAYGGMWESSRIVRTEKGNVMDWPTTNDTNNKAYLLSESGDASSAAAAVTFGTQPFEAYKYTSGLIQVSTELIEDSEFDLPSELVNMLAERIWRGTNEAFTTADGSSKPHGIIAAGNAVYGGSTSSDTALVYDDFVNLEHSVDPAYRKMPGAAFMFHDSVLREAKKIKDSQNLPIWNPGLMAAGAPSTLLGYKYVINQDMPIFWGGNATDNDNDKSLLFGDLRKYIIRQVRNMRIVRLNERYGELDQTAFVVFFRVDGDLLNAGTNPVKYLRVSAT